MGERCRWGTPASSTSPKPRAARTPTPPAKRPSFAWKVGFPHRIDRTLKSPGRLITLSIILIAVLIASVRDEKRMRLILKPEGVKMRLLAIEFDVKRLRAKFLDS